MNGVFRAEVKGWAARTAIILTAAVATSRKLCEWQDRIWELLPAVRGAVAGTECNLGINFESVVTNRAVYDYVL